MVLHLPKIHSDHRPLLIRHEKSFSSHVGLKPFKILASWLTDSRFWNFVATNWGTGSGHVQAANDFVKKVNEWNSNVFGNIFKRK